MHVFDSLHDASAMHSLSTALDHRHAGPAILAIFTVVPCIFPYLMQYVMPPI